MRAAPGARLAGPDGSGLSRDLGAMTESSLLQTIAELYGIEPEA